jgi:hypothetical protein
VRWMEQQCPHLQQTPLDMPDTGRMAPRCMFVMRVMRSRGSMSSSLSLSSAPSQPRMRHACSRYLAQWVEHARVSTHEHTQAGVRKVVRRNERLDKDMDSVCTWGELDRGSGQRTVRWRHRCGAGLSTAPKSSRETGSLQRRQRAAGARPRVPASRPTARCTLPSPHHSGTCIWIRYRGCTHALSHLHTTHTKQEGE